jgi:hypothetical protein
MPKKIIINKYRNKINKTPMQSNTRRSEVPDLSTSGNGWDRNLITNENPHSLCKSLAKT